MKISLDAMGGDFGPSVVVKAAAIAIERYPNIQLVLVGKEKRLEPYLKKNKIHDHPNITIHHATEVVAMDEKPSIALRTKKDSSMRVAVNLVKEGVVEACVSAGNTGALMATSKFVLKTLPGIDRPAIVYALPARAPNSDVISKIHMLDLGANIECSADHLFQFAVLGSVLCQSTEGKKNPRVALLNIGEEEIKGLENIKEAAKRLSECKKINYIGFVEGNDIFNTKADVIVCDGFTGNVALKTIEGVAKFLGGILKREFSKNLLTRLSSIGVMPILMNIKDQMDLKNFNGASFLGLKGIVIKSHGSADAEGFATAIGEAVREVEHNVPKQTASKLEDILSS